jgi:uncharacterized protein (TIGR02444 family)
MSTAAPEWPSSTFWDFSLRAYAQPAVERACLALQDDHGFDVNLVLLAAWAAGNGRQLDAGLAARLRQFGEGYQTSIMRPLRLARRALKSPAVLPTLAPLFAARRRTLSALELDLERLEQLQLHAMAAASAQSGDLPTDDPAGQAAARLEANLRALYPDRPLPPPALAALLGALPAVGDSTALTISD